MESKIEQRGEKRNRSLPLVNTVTSSSLPRGHGFGSSTMAHSPSLTFLPQQDGVLWSLLRNKVWYLSTMYHNFPLAYTTRRK